MDHEFKTEIKALFEKHNVVFEISFNKVCFYTEMGIGSTVTIFQDPDSEALEIASAKVN